MSEIIKSDFSKNMRETGAKQEELFNVLFEIGKIMDKDFILKCRNASDDKEKWRDFQEVRSFPVNHRLRLPYELIFEYDHCGRDMAIHFLSGIYSGIQEKLKRRGWNDYFLYLQDHFGRSPHLHFIPTAIKQYNAIKKYTAIFNIDHQVNNGKHLIRAEGGFYAKGEKTTYSSYFQHFRDIVPIYNYKDIIFPQINISLFHAKNFVTKAKKVSVQKNNNNFSGKIYDVPPVIESIMQKFTRGKKPSHNENWILAVYLINIGKSDTDIKNIFQVSKKYNEKITDTQLNFIRSRKYICPSYSKIQAWGIILAPEETNFKNPLNFKKLIINI
ncbi:MAG: hypothetical protein BWK75_04470 [Candidatus Altiarchaeales archaeon A3]|nr:MAG: hypothetical protein BWK75_04470 [Candidatus Altiarchaeales archaeon A3]